MKNRKNVNQFKIDTIKCFILFLVVFFSAKQSYAQDGIKEKLNEFANKTDQKNSAEVKEKTEEVRVLSKELDSVKAQMDSSFVKAQKADSIIEANKEAQKIVPEEAKMIDTLAYKSRFFAVKNRAPSKSKKEKEWSKDYLLTNTNVYKKKHILDSSSQVFGWHPFWMGTAYESYNFSLLSTIAYFSYELNPITGGYKTIHDWKTTSLIDSAKNNNCKVLLSVTNFGFKNNRTFLANSRAQKNFINTLISLLKERNANGVNLDFEQIPKSSRAAFNNFVIDVSSSLKLVDKEYKVTLAIPAIDFDGIYDVLQLNRHIDTYVVMGYEFYGKGSKVAGPIAPLSSGGTWWEQNLQTSVSDWLTLGIPKKKMLLGLPYYGSEWITQDLRFPSKVKSFVNYPMYRNIRKKFYGSGCCEDEESGSKYYAYRDNNNQIRQIWYEDSVSLGKKYDWVKSNKLGGIGIWALGYDNGYTELWELIASKFALSEKDQVGYNRRLSWRRIVSYVMMATRDPSRLLRNPRPLFGLFGAIFGVSMIGFFILFRYGNRLKRVFKLLIKSTIILLIIVAITLIFIAMRYTGFQEMMYLLGGVIIGVIIFLFISHRFISEKNLP